MVERSPGASAAGAAGSDLRPRILSGLALIALALAATWAGGLVFTALWLAAAVAVAVEWITITGARPRIALIAILAVGLTALLAAYVLEAPAFAEVAIAFVTAVSLVGIASTAASLGWTIAGFAYAATLALVPSMVRDLPGIGLAAILWMFAVVWATDVVAFFVGRALGGPKLWPAISPGKTWSGVAGGLVGGGVAGAAVVYGAARHGISLPASPGWLVLASLVASVASQVGDLAESAFKRRFGVKDSGRLIPGHGGMLDRLDGFAAVCLLVGFALTVTSAFVDIGSEP